MRVVERLHAVAISGEKQSPLQAVPDGQGKHATHALDGSLAVAFIQVQHRLGVRVGAVPDSARLELRLQRGVVEDLAVVDDDKAAIVAVHGLLTLREVHDAEPAVAEPYSGTDIQARPIRAAMSDQVAHALEQAPIGHKARITRQYAADTAHEGRIPAAGSATSRLLDVKLLPAPVSVGQ